MNSRAVGLLLAAVFLWCGGPPIVALVADVRVAQAIKCKRHRGADARPIIPYRSCGKLPKRLTVAGNVIALPKRPTVAPPRRIFDMGPKAPGKSRMKGLGR